MPDCPPVLTSEQLLPPEVLLEEDEELLLEEDEELLLEDDELLELLLELEELLEEELDELLLELELLLEDELELLLDEELEVLPPGTRTVQVGWFRLPSWLPWKPNEALVPPARLPFQPQQLLNCHAELDWLSPGEVVTFQAELTVTGSP